MDYGMQVYIVRSICLAISILWWGWFRWSRQMVQHPPEYSDDGKCDLISDPSGVAVDDLPQDI